MMKQYCRYCVFCFEGDVFYCSDHDEVLNEGKIKPKVDDGQMKFDFKAHSYE